MRAGLSAELHPRRIAVISTSRADFGLYLPLLRLAERDPEVDLHVIAGGMHLLLAFGNTIAEIEREGFRNMHRVAGFAAAKDAAADSIAAAMGRTTLCMAELLGQLAPDIVVALGDRFEMHAAVVAAYGGGWPLAHIHGGELTLGAMDDGFRHSITKLSHLHFVATESYGRRVAQLGEEPWRICVSGAPGLDNLADLAFLDREALAADLGFPVRADFIICTLHPETLADLAPQTQCGLLLQALAGLPQQILFTAANADPGGREINAAIEAAVAGRPNWHLVRNLGTRRYFSALRLAMAMVGNSSSGIAEAASFELPVLNIGQRQARRDRTRNVVDCDWAPAAIAAGLARVLDPAFRESLRGLRNPYGDGKASARILQRLKSVTLGDELLRKNFIDWPEPAAPMAVSAG